METDVAAALDFPLGDAGTEAKFNALKKLQALKVKSLMASIDALQKKNTELKVNGKDVRRTQMIQSLKNKLKNQELVADLLKAELVQQQPTIIDAKEDDKRKFLSVADVNNFIIKKTLGGPKRFRPLTREEMENKILDCDKTIEKLTKKLSELDCDVKRIQNSSATESKVAEPKVVALKVSKSDNKMENKGAEDSVQILQLMDQINSLKATLDVKSTILQEAKEEAARLRSKNAELKAINENASCNSKLYEEAQELYRRTSDELDDTVAALALAREENVLLLAACDADLDRQRAELDLVNSNYEVLLQQNTSLLSKMQQFEGTLASSPVREIDKFKTAPVALPSYVQSNSVVAPTAKENRVFEQKILNLRSKLLESESKCRELEEEPQKHAVLVEELRSKNDLIRDLKRNIAEINKQENSFRDSSPVRVSANDELVANLYDEIRRLKADISRQRKSVGMDKGTKLLVQFVDSISESFAIVLNDIAERVALNSSAMYSLEQLKSDIEGFMKSYSDDGSTFGTNLSLLLDQILATQELNEGDNDDESPFNGLKSPGGR